MPSKDTKDSFHSADYFDVWRSGCDSDDQFKEMVLKDQETVSLVSALVMTVAFAALAVTVHGASLFPRTVYLGSVAAGIAFSLLGSLIAVRTLILLNSVPAERIVEALREIGKRRYSPSLNPFAFTWYSLLSLMVSTVSFTYCEYGLGETAIVMAIMVFTGYYLYMEDKMHHELGQVFRGRGKKKLKRT